MSSEYDPSWQYWYPDPGWKSGHKGWKNSKGGFDSKNKGWNTVSKDRRGSKGGGKWERKNGGGKKGINNAFGKGAKDDFLTDWLSYSKMANDLIADHIFCCKTPLRSRWEGHIKDPLDHFRLPALLDDEIANRFPDKKLALVVNLANTERYYNGSREALLHLGYPETDYWHFRTPGRQNPDLSAINEFCHKVRTAATLSDDSKNRLVVVHCTHGVNRTGFFVIAYLLKFGYCETVEEGRELFERVRGEKIKRPYLLEELQRLVESGELWEGKEKEFRADNSRDKNKSEEEKISEDKISEDDFRRRMWRKVWEYKVPFLAIGALTAFALLKAAKARNQII